MSSAVDGLSCFAIFALINVDLQSVAVVIGDLDGPELFTFLQDSRRVSECSYPDPLPVFLFSKT